MKVTDTHPAAAEHFDYLEKDPEPAPSEPVEGAQGGSRPQGPDELGDLVEATTPRPAPGHSRPRSA